MKYFYLLFLSCASFALQFNDEESYVSAKELGKKIPYAFAACGTLIHPNWVLTLVNVGDVKQIIIKGKKYIVDRREIGASNKNIAPKLQDKHYFFQFQLLHLAQPVEEIDPAASYFYKNGRDFVLDEAASVAEDGILGFFVGPAIGTDAEKKGCTNLSTIDFDEAKVVGAIPVQASKRGYNDEAQLSEISSYKASSGPTKIERYDIQQALYSDLFKTNIPIIVEPEQSAPGGGIFVVLGKKSDQISSTDIVMIGINQGKATDKGKPNFKSLIEGKTQFWIGDTIYPDDKPAIWPSRVFADEFTELVKQKSFVLSIDFSDVAQKIRTDFNFTGRRMDDFSNFFSRNYEISHFAVSKQSTLVRLFNLEAEASISPLDVVYGFTGGGKYDIEKRAPKLTFKSYKNKNAAILVVPSFKMTNPNNKEQKWYQPQLVEELLKEAQEKAEILVLDLRDNDGGAVSNSKHLLKTLAGADIEGFDVTKEMYREATEHIKELPRHASDVKKDELIILAKYLDQKYPIKKEIEPLFRGKVIVIINKKTSSAGESTALALNEFLGSELIGQTTAGKVLLSTFSPISYGFEGHYPVADYISRKGYRIEGVGVIPTDLIPPYIDSIDYVFSLRDIFQEKLKKVKEILLDQQVEIVVKNGDIIINLGQNIFKPKQDIFELSFDLEKIKQALAVFAGYKIDVKCFADKNEAPADEERGKLSQNRAEAFKRKFIENNVVTKDKLFSSGIYSFEINQEKNNSRRVEIIIKQAMQ